MNRKRHSAYDLPFAVVELSGAERRLALLWWQDGIDFHPLVCPVCAAKLVVAPEQAVLLCPTDWCNFQMKEIPWGVYAAWQAKKTR